MSHDRELSPKAQQVRVLLRGVRVFGSARVLLLWLETPCAALGNSVPISLLESREGIALVEAVLDMMEYGLVSL
ncbi:MAG: MbcA/ParS/Xre antitoxin family protein [Syntrophorhabdales bacterium]|jgi:uncharacterized protein (DUF2384 family)